MTTPSIHFAFDKGRASRPDSYIPENFAHSLIQDLGQTDFDKADVIVSVGGDGKLLETFSRAAKGQKCFGLTPPLSNSHGFWTNHDINDSTELMQAISIAQSHNIKPLKTEVSFSDGRKTLLRSFGEITFMRHSAQAALVNLSIHFPDMSIGPIRFMGDGINFSRPYGSTGLNKGIGGATVDIRIPSIQVTGIAVHEPVGFPSTVAQEQTKFEIEFLSPHKRTIRLDYDGKSIASDMTNPISRLMIEHDDEHYVELMLTENPATRAFAALL